LFFFNGRCLTKNSSDLSLFEYRTRAIIGRSRFEATLVYKPRILSLKNEEFPFLVHKLSAIISRSQGENWLKKVQAAAYNGAHTVHCSCDLKNLVPSCSWPSASNFKSFLGQ
jgi:hypothetical protein